LSGPLRDRIDLSVQVTAVPARELEHASTGESTTAIRARVVAARDRQLARDGILNAQLQGRALRVRAALDPAGRLLLERALQKLAITARGFDRLLRVSRTIADLDGSDTVLADHLAEALQFRAQE
jgi:magnesium chelatase family protein